MTIDAGSPEPPAPPPYRRSRRAEFIERARPVLADAS
jgi:hypothetical protein